MSKAFAASPRPLVIHMIDASQESVVVTVDGVSYTLARQTGGSGKCGECIRVVAPIRQMNAMTGPNTAGEMWFDVHPVQRNQYEYWRALMPPALRPTAAAEALAQSQRPWWSLGSGEGGRE